MLIDLDEMPADDPLAGFDVELLRDDVLGRPPAPLPGLPGGKPGFFAEAG